MLLPKLSSRTRHHVRLVAREQGVTTLEAQRRLIAYGALLYLSAHHEGRDVITRNPDTGECHRVVLTELARPDPPPPHVSRPPRCRSTVVDPPPPQQTGTVTE